MNGIAGMQGLGQYNASRGNGFACLRRRTEHEESPPFGLVMLVFLVAMAGGVYVSCTLDNLAFGWIACVGILAALGAVVDRFFCGAAALERRLSARSRARQQAVCKATLKCNLRRQRLDWQSATTREWTSMSAYRRHPQRTRAARADSFRDSTRQDSHAECHTRPA